MHMDVPANLKLFCNHAFYKTILMNDIQQREEK